MAGTESLCCTSSWQTCRGKKEGRGSIAPRALIVAAAFGAMTLALPEQASAGCSTQIGVGIGVDNANPLIDGMFANDGDPTRPTH